MYEYFGPLSAIFGEAKNIASSTVKVATSADSELKDIKGLGNVDLALYTGQFTRDESAGVDVLIVGDINQAKLVKFIAELEAKEGKEIRYTIMTVSEFVYRQQVKDRFLDDVLKAKNQVFIDKQGVFSKDKQGE